MNYLIILIRSKLFFFGFLLVFLYSCEVTEPVLNPDYTGQIGQITDIQGNVYKTVGIGSQIWMAENLRTLLLNDGSRINTVSDDSLWNRTNAPGLCWYENGSISYEEKYGALYNFHTVETGLLCPAGWHVPDKSEWETLVSILGGDDIAGGKLKDYYSSSWQGSNYCIVNNYGFSALPGGQRLIFTGRFVDVGLRGYWWTGSSMDSHFAYSRSVFGSSLELNIFASGKNYGFSIRCIKDEV